MAKPLRLNRWTGIQARALSIIARHGFDRRFMPGPETHGEARGNTGVEPWNFRMLPSRARTPAGASSATVQSDNACPGEDRLVGLDWNGARLWLRLSPNVCNDWLAVRAPELDIDALPAQFIDAAWEAMLANVLDVLGIARFCPGMRVVDKGTHTGHAAYAYAWTVSMQVAGTARTIEAELGVDDDGLQCLADLLGRLRTQDVGDAFACAAAPPVIMSARAGEAILTASELGGLEVGDVLLLERTLATLDGDAWLCTPDGQGVRVRACEPGAPRYVVTQEWSLLMNDDVSGPVGLQPEPDDSHPVLDDFRSELDDTRSGWDDNGSEATGTGMQDEDRPPGTEETGLDVDRIPVRLAFDLGEHSMTLGELRRLKPGEFFTLQRRIDAGPVHIRANGTLIGTAELVDIDGRVGARVLTLIPGGNTCG